MGLSSITNRVAYQGDGTSTIFSFPYYFFNPSDLAVYLFDINSSVIYPQTLNTNYTISGAVNSQGVYPSGGAVVMASSFPTNLDLIITRGPAQVQNFVLNQNSPINSLALVQQFDYLTALIQRLQDEVSRSVILPDGVGPINGSSFSTLLPANISQPGVAANQVLAVNSGATGFQLVTVAGAGSGSSSVLSVAFGGTGQSSPLAPGGVIYGISTSQMGVTAAGTAGQVLQSQGSGAPVWVTSGSSGGSITGSVSLTTQVSGILPVANGGTNLSNILPLGGVIWASSATSFGVVAPGTAGQYLQYVGSSSPVWATVSGGASGSTSLTNQVSGILPLANGGTNTNSFPVGTLIFASSSTTLASLPGGTAGAVLGSNGSSAPAWTSSLGFPIAPNIQILTGSSGTYTTPTSPSPIYLEVIMVGGGGGGGGAGAGGSTNGTTGGSSIFGTNLFVAAGGGGGATNSGSGDEGGAGGFATIASSYVGIAVAGSYGSPGAGSLSGGGFIGGSGGPSAFGGAGGGTLSGTTGRSGSPNTGGGGGGTANSLDSSAGGGSGGYVRGFITSSIASSYTYTVGNGGVGGIGSGGGAATNGGAGGGAMILVKAHYQ